MTVKNIKRLSDYFNYLRKNPVEIDALYKEFLIKVTSFFRDPKAFEVLKKRIFPYLHYRPSHEDPDC
jgi:two-component system CheB/CheR fusion protein